MERRHGHGCSPLCLRVMFFDATWYKPVPVHVNQVWKSLDDTFLMVKTAVEVVTFFMTLTKKGKQQWLPMKAWIHTHKPGDKPPKTNILVFLELTCWWFECTHLPGLTFHWPPTWRYTEQAHSLHRKLSSSASSPNLKEAQTYLEWRASENEWESLCSGVVYLYQPALHWFPERGLQARNQYVVPLSGTKRQMMCISSSIALSI